MPQAGGGAARGLPTLLLWSQGTERGTSFCLQDTTYFLQEGGTVPLTARHKPCPRSPVLGVAAPSSPLSSLRPQVFLPLTGPAESFSWRWLPCTSSLRPDPQEKHSRVRGKGAGIQLWGKTFSSKGVKGEALSCWRLTENRFGVSEMDTEPTSSRNLGNPGTPCPELGRAGLVEAGQREILALGPQTQVQNHAGGCSRVTPSRCDSRCAGDKFGDKMWALLLTPGWGTTMGRVRGRPSSSSTTKVMKALLMCLLLTDISWSYASAQTPTSMLGRGQRRGEAQGAAGGGLGGLSEGTPLFLGAPTCF